MSGWRDKAACRDMDPDLFFPTTSSEERLALKACAQCPAICECARYAAEHALINGYPAARRMGWREQEQKKESK